MIILAIIPIVGFLVGLGGVAAFFYGFWVHALGWVLGGIAAALAGAALTTWFVSALSDQPFR